jgi:hypothetical protein
MTLRDTTILGHSGKKRSRLWLGQRSRSSVEILKNEMVSGNDWLKTGTNCL